MIKVMNVCICDCCGKIVEAREAFSGIYYAPEGWTCVNGNVYVHLCPSCSSVFENLSKNKKFKDSVDEHYAKKLQMQENVLKKKPWGNTFNHEKGSTDVE